MTETTAVDAAPASATLAAMLWQGQVAHTLIVTAQLGLADRLAQRPQRAEELAAATNTHPRGLYRLLCALSGLGVVAAHDDGSFTLTPLAEPLRTGVPGSLCSLAQYLSVEMQAWGCLLHSVQTGESAWQRALGVGQYEYFARHPEANTSYNEIMTALSWQALPDILAAYDFAEIETLVDLGGGCGLLLAGILRAYPRMQGVLVDLPHVVAEAPPVLEGSGVAGRCRVVAGDFVSDVPPEADAYILKNIVLGMSDEEAVRIFRACRAKMSPHSRLLVINVLMGTGAAVGQGAKSDLRLMVIFGQAGARTEDELRALLAAGGFRVARVLPAGRAGAVVEALPA